MDRQNIPATGEPDMAARRVEIRMQESKEHDRREAVR